MTQLQFENFHFHSRRSNIIAENGVVATSQPLAAQVGIDVLKSGGNAVDAAVATIAAMCVVEPCSTGIGGDAFALIWNADQQKLYGINASGPAPQGLTADFVRSQGYTTFPQLGPLSVTVPGSLRGWELALNQFGTKGLDSLLQQPISYAQNGFPVSERIAAQWRRSQEKMSVYPDSKRVWVPNGQTPKVGERFRNPEFAQTLKRLANDGYDAFYQGEIGKQIVQSIQAVGGVLTEDDLANYHAEWVEPIQSQYGDGFTFHEIPPNGQGLTALIALNLAAGFDLKALGYGTADYYHALIEIMKLSFADAHAYIADPRQNDIPTNELLSPAYADKRRALIQMSSAQAPSPGQPMELGDTVYLTVADGEGNMVSWIQSLYEGFGSGLTAGKTGVQLQNRGANFNLEPGHPNEAAPGKRPYHTIIPGFISRHGRAWSSFGVMGGFMQPQGHLQVGLNLVAFGMDPQTALDAPRFNWLNNKRVALETAVSASVRHELSRRGHSIPGPDFAGSFGGGQVIVRHPETGMLIGGSEPRKDGCAVGW